MKPFTDRQCQIFALIMAGWSDKQIAVHLKVGFPTVKTHVATILAKLNARNRAHAVAIALTGERKDYFEEVAQWNQSSRRKRFQGIPLKPATFTSASPPTSTTA